MDQGSGPLFEGCTVEREGSPRAEASSQLKTEKQGYENGCPPELNLSNTAPSRVLSHALPDLQVPNPDRLLA